MIKTMIETEIETNEATVEGIELSTLDMEDEIVTVTLGSESVNVEKIVLLKLLNTLYEPQMDDVNYSLEIQTEEERTVEGG